MRCWRIAAQSEAFSPEQKSLLEETHSARLNGHDPYTYLKDVLERLPTQPASRVEELLPHRWLASRAAT